MANVRIKDLVNSLTDPETDLSGNYLETDHAINGSKKMTLEDARRIITQKWGQPPGWAKLDGVDDYYSIADNDNLEMGTGGYTIVWNGQINETPTGTSWLAGKFGRNAGNNQWLGIYTTSLKRIVIICYSGANALSSFSANDSYEIDKDLQIIASYNRSTAEGKLYLNGILIATLDITLNNSVDFNSDGAFGINWNNVATPLKTTVYGVKVYNKSITQAEVTALYNNGRPDLAAIPYKYRGASQTALTSGTLIVGYEYIIDTYVAGDDFTNVGATSNASGVTFTATGTTPTTWTNGSSLRHIGVVFEARPESFGKFGLVDYSGNGLHGNSSGSPISLNRNREIYTDAKVAITGATTLTNIVPAGYRLKSIFFEETAGFAVTGGVKIGTISGGADVVSAETVGANSEGLMTIAKDFFSSTTEQTLYIDAVTAWNSASINLIFKMEKV